MSVHDLNTLQQLALDAAIAGQNLFITGGAGTGKTRLVHVIKQRLGAACVVAAPTGLAALNAGGSTVHSLFRDGAAALVNARTLLIDECSMLPPDLVTNLYATAKRGRKCNAPWGGLQVILIGDLCQLPPVVASKAHRGLIAQRYSGNPFFFASHVFKGFKLIELSETHRQTDPLLITALNDIRHGRASLETLAIFDKCLSARPPDAPVIVVTNARAAAINATELANLPGAPVAVVATTTGNFSERDYPNDATLLFKVGARVLMLRNEPDNSFCNGDTGTIVDFDAADCVARVRLDRGCLVRVSRVTWSIKEARLVPDAAGALKIVESDVGTFTQLPMRLGYALTVHKAQGLSLDRAHVDLEKGVFTHGQAYVALSRVRSLAGLSLERPLRASDFVFDNAALAYSHVFQPLTTVAQQVRGCAAHNHTGRPWLGNTQLPYCPLSNVGCPRAVAATTEETRACV